MNNAAEILVAPFKKIWEALAAQSNATQATHASIDLALNLPSHLHEISEELTKALGGTDKLPMSIGKLAADAGKLRQNVHSIYIANPEAFTYPTLIGQWSIVEAAIEDLGVRILSNDAAALAKVQALSIKLPKQAVPGSEEYWRSVWKRLERQMGTPRVVETHAALLGTFEIPLTYPDNYKKLIEEINQARNCILHRNGVIDQKAANIAPRLQMHLGKPIPSNDPIFIVAPTMLADYTLALLWALVHSPYLSAGLKPEERHKAYNSEPSARGGDTAIGPAPSR